MDKITIDLDKLKRQSVDIERSEEEESDSFDDLEAILEADLLLEGELEMFGAQIKLMLQRMFGMNSLPVEVTGSRNDVRSFATLMGREKDYIEKMSKYGLNDPKVIKDKYRLKDAIHRFERDTGISYPFSIKR